MRKIGQLLLSAALAACAACAAEPVDPKTAAAEKEKLEVPCVYTFECNARETGNRLRAGFPAVWRPAEAARGELEYVNLLLRHNVGYLLEIHFKVERRTGKVQSFGTAFDEFIYGKPLKPDTDVAWITITGKASCVYPPIASSVETAASGEELDAEHEALLVKGVAADLVAKASKLFPGARPPVPRARLLERQKQLVEAPIMAALAESERWRAAGRIEEARAAAGRALVLAHAAGKKEFAERAAALDEALREPLVEERVEKARAFIAGGAFDQGDRTLASAVAIATAPSAPVFTDVRIEAVRGTLALDRTDDALARLAKLANAPAERTTAVDQLRREVWNRIVAMIDDRLERALVEDGAKLADSLERAMPERRADMGAVRGRIAQRGREVARTLAGEAARRKDWQYYEAEPLLRRAATLDPESDEVRAVAARVRASAEKHAPAFVRELVITPERDGYSAYFTIANAKGQMIAAPGRAFLTFVGVQGGRRVRDFGGIDQEVGIDDYLVMAVDGGTGPVKRLHLMPRVPLASIGLSTKGAREGLRGAIATQQLAFTAVLSFRSAGGSTLELAREVAPPR